MRYRVEDAVIEAGSHTEAATLYARERYGPRAFGRRETGVSGLSGVFVPYVDATTSDGWAVRKVGRSFHVMCLED